MFHVLARIRLIYYYRILFMLYLVIVLKANKIQLGGGPLTLSSVNSFLLAFYKAKHIWG